jgi:hypothetical protein
MEHGDASTGSDRKRVERRVRNLGHRRYSRWDGLRAAGAV